MIFNVDTSAVAQSLEHQLLSRVNRGSNPMRLGRTVGKFVHLTLPSSLRCKYDHLAIGSGELCVRTFLTYSLYHCRMLLRKARLCHLNMSARKQTGKLS